MEKKILLLRFFSSVIIVCTGDNWCILNFVCLTNLCYRWPVCNIPLQPYVSLLCIPLRQYVSLLALVGIYILLQPYIYISVIYLFRLKYFCFRWLVYIHVYIYRPYIYRITVCVTYNIIN